jgi:four helix bundle protein
MKSRKGWYSFERLEVYELAVRVRRIVMKIIARLPAEFAADVDQLKRSTKSAVRNICEGGGEFKPREKARFYRMSLRSTEETGGSLLMLEEDRGPDPLFDEAHEANHILIAKLKTLCRNKGA